MEFLFLPWLGTPLWMWLLFVALVVALLVFDLGVLHKDDHEIGVSESLKLSAMYIAMAWASPASWPGSSAASRRGTT